MNSQYHFPPHRASPALRQQTFASAHPKQTEKKNTSEKTTEGNGGPCTHPSRQRHAYGIWNFDSQTIRRVNIGRNHVGRKDGCLWGNETWWDWGTREVRSSRRGPTIAKEKCLFRKVHSNLFPCPGRCWGLCEWVVGGSSKCDVGEKLAWSKYGRRHLTLHGLVTSAPTYSEELTNGCCPTKQI